MRLIGSGGRKNAGLGLIKLASKRVGLQLITGAISAALFNVTSAIASIHGVSGDASASPQLITAAASGNHGVNAIASPEIVGMVSTISGSHGVSGAISSTLEQLVLYAVGGDGNAFQGTVNSILFSPLLTSSGLHSVSGSTNASLDNPTLTASGSHIPHVGMVSASLFTPNAIASGIHAEQEVISYQSAVLSNSGTVSTATINALNTFVSGAKADGFWSKLNFLWIPLGDYAASTVALKHSAVNQLVTRVNFVSGDYSESTGYNPGVSNSTKHIDCNMTPQAMTGSTTTGSFGVYSHSTFDEAGLSIGASVNSSTSRITIRPRFTGPGSQTYSEAWDTNYTTGGGLQFASEDGSGLWVLNRTSTSNATISRNASIIGTNTRTISSTVPNINLLIFAGNFAGSVVGYSGRRQSMVFGGAALTNTDISNFWTRLQTLYSAISRSL